MAETEGEEDSEFERVAVRVGEDVRVIDAVAVMLDHELCRFGIDPDQEITGRIQGDEALGELVIEGLTGRMGGRWLGWGHGADRRQP